MEKEDIVSSGPERPPWRPARWTTVTAAALALAGALVAGIAVWSGGAGSDRATQPPRGPTTLATNPAPDRPDLSFPPRPDASERAAGLVVTGVAVPRDYTLVRRDPTADKGPWTVTVRHADGSLARHGAVLTFPVSAPGSGRNVRIGEATGRSRDGEVTWPVADAYARVRGDLSRRELLRIAASATVVSGRPHVAAPSGLSVTATGTARSAYATEARYSADEVGETAALGHGLVFTRITRSGGIEDALYGTGAQPSGTVHGKAAVFSSALGGNGALVWEPAPGVVAYVGYSGAALDSEAVAALHRVAERTRLLDARQWLSTNPQIIDAGEG
ncbi:hypothetical protein ACYF6T_39395 [Streptomyces sp. 7R007]